MNEERLNDRERTSATMSVIVFLGYTLAGIAFIAAAKNYGYSQVVATSVPIGVMILYAVMMLYSRKLRLRDDQAGDNLYYMGFIFTLVSLGTSLLQFEASRGADEIVRNFGIAIATTMAGIFFRIMFGMIRYDPAEIERTSRIELAEAARRLRRELDNTVIDFGHFRRATQQSVTEGFVEVRESLTQSCDSILQNMNALAEASSNHLAEMSRRSAETSTDFSNAVSKLIAKLSDMQTPDKIIEIKMNPTIQGLSRNINSMDKSVERQVEVLQTSIKSMAENFKAFERLLQSSSGSNEAIQLAVAESVQTLKTSVDGAVDFLARTRTENIEASVNLQKLSETISSEVGKLAFAIQELQISMERTRTPEVEVR